MDFVVRQVAAAINEALDRLQPAELRMASGEARGKIAYNYYAPDLYDRGVSVLQARTTGGRPIGTLVNYAVHPEVLGSAQGILSRTGGTLCDRLNNPRGCGAFHERRSGGHCYRRQPEPGRSEGPSSPY